MHIFRNESWPAIMVIGAFISGILLGQLPSHGDWQPKWEMVSAIGTIAAAVVALFIALGEGIRRDREAYAKAQLTAARITPHLAMVSRRLGYIAEGARNCITTNAPVKSRDRLLAEFDEAELNVSDDDLLTLTPLPHRSAFLLAGAKGHMETIRHALSMVCGHTYPEDRERINKGLDIVAFVATEAQQQVTKAMYECQKASIVLTSPHH